MKSLLGVLCLTGTALAASFAAPTEARANYFECTKVGAIVEAIGGGNGAAGPNIAVWCPSFRPGTGVAGVQWIMIPAGASYAQRFLSTAQAAFLSGRVFYGFLQTSAPCVNNDCRVATQFGVRLE